MGIDAARALLSFFMSADRYLGLLSGDVEATAQEGTYRRQRMPAVAWRLEAVDGGARIVGAGIAFTGFVGAAPVSGFFVAATQDSPILFPIAFIDGQVRHLIAEDDVLTVVPIITVEG